MAGPDATLRVGKTTVHVLGTIPGFVPDGRRVEEAAARHAPACIALGVPPEDIDALDALADDPAIADDLPEPDEWQVRLMELLSPWGQTRIPSPDLAAAHAAARSTGLPLEPLDLDDEAHTDAHTRRLKLRHIVRMNRARNRLLKMTFTATDPYGLVRQWDAVDNRGRALAAVQAEREDHMAQRIRELATDHASLLAVVPAARWDGVVRRLGADA